MTRPHRTRARLLGAGLAAALLTTGLGTSLDGAAAASAGASLGASLGASPGASPGASGERRAAPVVELTLSRLEQGEPPAVPFLTYEGRLVDGDTDIWVKGRSTTLLGEYDGTYVYARYATRTGFKDVLRIAPDRTVTRVATLDGEDAVALSDDGTTLATLTSRRKASDLRVISTAIGSVLFSDRLRLSWPNLLDVDAEHVLLGSWDQPGTYSVPLDVYQDLTRITKRIGYSADITLDRLATMTKDPYLGGCSAVSTLTHPKVALTKSCTDRAQAFSTDGSRTANVDLLSDGIGPSRVLTRTTAGRRIATYDAPYYFGQVVWEDADTVLLHTYSKRRSALVRCTGADCEIAVPDLGEPQARTIAPRAAWSPR